MEVGDKGRKGVALANFIPPLEGLRLSCLTVPVVALTLGDEVVVTDEVNNHWYVGYKVTDEKKWGIFPKNFIRTYADQGGSKHHAFLATKIESTLKEWIIRCENYYKDMKGFSFSMDEKALKNSSNICVVWISW